MKTQHWYAHITELTLRIVCIQLSCFKTCCILFLFPWSVYLFFTKCPTAGTFVLVSGCRFDLQPASSKAEGAASLALSAVPGTQRDCPKDQTCRCPGEHHLLSSKLPDVTFLFYPMYRPSNKFPLSTGQNAY